jgi:hypothetical protein
MKVVGKKMGAFAPLNKFNFKKLMKKILILLTSFIYSISVNANFDLKSCQNEYFNNCPSYSI